MVASYVPVFDPELISGLYIDKFADMWIFGGQKSVFDGGTAQRSRLISNGVYILLANALEA